MLRLKSFPIAAWKQKANSGYRVRLFLCGSNILKLDAQGILNRGSQMFYSEDPETRLTLAKIISPRNDVAVLGRDRDAFWIARKEGNCYRTCAYWQGSRKFAGMSKEELFCNMAMIAGI